MTVVTTNPTAATRNRRTGKLYNQGITSWHYDKLNGGFYIKFFDGQEIHFSAEPEALGAIAIQMLRGAL